MTVGSTLPVLVATNDYHRVGESIADILQLVIGKIDGVQMSLNTESVFENWVTNTEESAVLV